jgi:hypothetical protein
MPSTARSIPHVAQGGFDRSLARHVGNPATFWELLNLKPEGGRLVQTKGIGAGFSLTQLVGEVFSPAKLIALTRTLSGNLRYLIMNHVTARFVDPENTVVQVHLPVILQTKVPNNPTARGQCLLYGFNVTDFAAAGDLIEVKITSATTFQWRRNAGAWSANLTISGETSLGANGLKVSFQQAGDGDSFDGYTVDNLWQWTRQDALPYSGAEPTCLNFPYKLTPFNTDNYIAGVSRNVLRVRDNFVTSVGYTRVYGKYCTTLANHLIVGHFAMAKHDVLNGIADAYDSRTTPFTLGWSHLENPDQFYGTDINEADDYKLDEQYDPQFSHLGITALIPWRNQVYIFLPSAIYTMYYIGMPQVFKVDPLNQNLGSIFSSGTVRTPRGVYFIGRDNVYRITGTDPEPVGWQVRKRFFEDMKDPADPKYNQTWGSYDANSQEVSWTYFIKQSMGVYQCRQMIFREESGLWYFRNLPSGNNLFAEDMYSRCEKYNSGAENPVSIYGGAGVVYEEMDAAVYTDQITGGGVISHTEPMAETQMIGYGGAFRMKETSALHVDAGWNHSAGLQVATWAADTIGKAEPNFVDINPAWTPTTPEARLTFPIRNFRHIAYRFKFLRGAANYVMGAVLNIWEEFVYGLPEDKEK